MLTNRRVAKDTQHRPTPPHRRASADSVDGAQCGAVEAPPTTAGQFPGPRGMSAPCHAADMESSWYSHTKSDNACPQKICA